MKKIIFLITFALVFGASKSQSITFNFGYIHYFLNQKSYPDQLKIDQEINHSLGGCYLKYFKSSSLECGYYFATKNFEFDFPKPYYSGERIEITSSYHHFPILYSQRLCRKDNFGLAATTGMIFITVNEYSEKTIYEDTTFISNDGSNIDFTVGLMAHFGLKFSLLLNKYFVVFATTNYDFKYFADYAPGNPNEIPSADKSQLSFRLGVELLFKKDLRYFNP